MLEKSNAVFAPLMTTSAFEAFVLHAMTSATTPWWTPEMITIQSPFFFGGTGFKWRSSTLCGTGMAVRWSVKMMQTSWSSHWPCASVNLSGNGVWACLFIQLPFWNVVWNPTQIWKPCRLAPILGSRKNAPEPREYQIGFSYFVHERYLVQFPFPPKLVLVARQPAAAGLVCVAAEVALGASNPSRRMAYST